MSERRQSFSTPFIVAAATLLISALGVHGYLWANGYHLIKSSVELREPLFLMEREVGPYRRIEARRISSEQLEEVGTDHYLDWTFENRDREGDGRSVHLFVAYYTGMPESRPRIPTSVHLVPGTAEGEAECRPLQLGEETMGEAAALLSDDAVLCVRSYRPPSTNNGLPVAYLYVANGKIVDSPEAVHERLADPAVPHAWWAKVEVLVANTPDPEEQREAAERFLTHALPVIAESLPGTSTPSEATP